MIWKKQRICSLRPSEVSSVLAGSSADGILNKTSTDAVTSSTATTGLYDLEQLKYLQILLQRYEQKPVERRQRIVGERRIICMCVTSLQPLGVLTLISFQVGFSTTSVSEGVPSRIDHR